MTISSVPRGIPEGYQSSSLHVTKEGDFTRNIFIIFKSKVKATMYLNSKGGSLTMDVNFF